ncbi:MAG: GreA/GreB family elongation factor, partial [Planctomycetota bacterium]
PKKTAGLNLPTDVELFRIILDTLSALGATLAPPPEVGRAFRNRVKAALGLRNYAKVTQSISQVSPAAAVTIRRQLDRLEGLGDNAPARMLDVLQDAHPHLWVRRIERIEPWADPDVLWATTAGLKKRTDERDELVNVKMAENAKRIGEAAALGDLSENSEYKFALEERDLLRARLAQINRELSLAQTFTEKDVPLEYVGVGSCVKLRARADGAERIMRFLGPFETDVDNGTFNYQAPVSQKLMGLHVGEHATFTIDGQEREFEIMDISNALSRS